MRNVYEKRMASGKYIDLGNLTLDDLFIDDIDISLNHIIRFDGHFKNQPPLSVAAHSLLCLNLAKDAGVVDPHLLLAIFTHDFAEAYIGDVSSPVKKILGNSWYEFAEPIENLVHTKFNVKPINPEIKQFVKIFDYASMDVERRTMWKDQTGKDKWPPNLLNIGTVSDKNSKFTKVAWYFNMVPVKEIWKELYDIALQTESA